MQLFKRLFKRQQPQRPPSKLMLKVEAIDEKLDGLIELQSAMLRAQAMAAMAKTSAPEQPQAQPSPDNTSDVEPFESFESAEGEAPSE